MSDDHAALRQALLDWFDVTARDLPWRGSDDPYAVLVCEVMSQQTRIETVCAYWTRWMLEFPTLLALAQADADHVMRMWAGLGYYRRARSLHACARLVAAGTGALPGTAEELQALPGIGAYTAAAVASIVFGEAVPAIDGNVSRVMARLHAIDGDPSRAAFRHAVLERASPLIDHQRAGDSNEALMELGATVCTPRNPDCAACPLVDRCMAAGQGEPTRYPAPKPRKPPRHETMCSVVVLGDDGAVFVRRGKEELLGGLWEFPSYRGPSLGDAVASCRDEHGLSGAYEHLGAVEHVFSHIKMTYQVICVRGRRAGARGGRWLFPEELAGEGFSVAMRRVASAVPELADN